MGPVVNAAVGWRARGLSAPYENKKKLCVTTRKKKKKKGEGGFDDSTRVVAPFWSHNGAIDEIWTAAVREEGLADAVVTCRS